MLINLYYLFVSGLVLGSGPCLTLCAPILISYTAIYRNSLKKSLYTYLIFSLYKLLGYALIGLVAGLSVKIINNPRFADYLNYIYIFLALLMVIIGITILFEPEEKTNKFCRWLHKGNFRNVGILGLMVGLSPCLPLLGILNYVVIISDSVPEAIFLTLVFGVGTILSPLIFAVLLSAKLGNWFSTNKKLKLVLKIICGGILVALGSRIILQRLQL